MICLSVCLSAYLIVNKITQKLQIDINDISFKEMLIMGKGKDDYTVVMV